MLKRTKRRYLALQIDSTETVDQTQLMNTLWNAITKLYGEHGTSQTGLILIEYDPDEKLAVIRTNNTALNMTRASIVTITKIEEKPVAIHVLAISGTIKALYKNLGH